MERLSLLDQVFHKIGGKGIPALNMQGGMIINPANCEFKIDAQVLVDHLASRMSKLDIMRKKLVQDPLKLGDVKLIDDPEFDVYKHISVVTLPKPGNYEQLSHAIGEFSAKSLDADLPPWEFCVFDGIEDGSYAVFQKLSHATMDGMTAMKVIQSIFDLEPTAPETFEPVTFKTKPAPTKLALLGEAYNETVNRSLVYMPRAMIQISRMAAGASKDALKKRFDALVNSQVEEAESIKVDTAPKHECKAPRTSLNRAISMDKRLIAFANYDLKLLKALSKKLDCTLNELCLLMISDSLNTYFKGVNEEIDGNFVIGVPMNTRDETTPDRGNKLSVSLINTYSANENLLERLAGIKEQTQAAKQVRSGKGKTKIVGNFDNIIATISPIVLDGLVMLLDKVKPWSKLPMIGNTGLSNVPGPRSEVYFSGMPVKCSIPMVPIAPNFGVNFGVTSIGNVFSFGIHGCGQLINESDMHLFVDGLNKAYLDLKFILKNPTKSPSSRRTKKVDALISSSYS